MKKKRKWLIAVVISLSIHSAFSQINYIATDSTLHSGIKLIEGTARENAQFISVERNKQVVKYTPIEIKEFGFKNGRTFVSKNILISGISKKVFLEKLVSGTLTLYYYIEKGKETYFIEKDSAVFTEISKDNGIFKKIIAQNTTDCKWVADKIKLVKYRKRSLSKLTAFYNNCEDGTFAYIKFGVIAGYNRAMLILPKKLTNESLTDLSFPSSSSLLIGIYADMPILMSNFSVNAGVNFTKNGFLANMRSPESDVDAIVNISTFDVPVLLRYTMPNVKYRPFANIGGVFSYHIKNTNQIYISSINEDVISIHDLNTETFLDDYLIGYTMGVGFQYNLNYRKTITAELRYDYYFGSQNTLNMSHIKALIGFSL